MEVPEGFTLTNEFSGFVNNKTGATVIVAMLPPANDNIKNIFNNEQKFKSTMAEQNYDVKQHMYRKTRDGFLLTIYQGKQTSQNGVFDKWATIIFSSNAAYVVTVQAPEKADFSNDEAMKIYSSLSLSGDNDETEQLRALPFTFSIQPPFGFVGSIMNRSAMLTINSGDEDADFPDIIITKGFELVGNKPLEQLVDNYLQSIKGTIDGIKRLNTSPINFAGHPGLRLQAEGTMKGNSVDLVIYVAVGNDGHAIFMHVSGKKGMLANYSKEIEKTAESIKLRNDVAE